MNYYIHLFLTECHILDPVDSLNVSLDEASVIELVIQSKASKQKLQMKANKVSCTHLYCIYCL